MLEDKTGHHYPPIYMLEGMWSHPPHITWDDVKRALEEMDDSEQAKKLLQTKF